MAAVQATTTTRHTTHAIRQVFVAAVRYPDGRRDLFHVVNARDLADAREMVLLEVGDVGSLLIAPRH